ncbi:MAG: hypothetical protein J0L99_09865 [Chitinophagales bacterium]|nr:hypothetical protein [Chitinophagales bacterium]
MHTKEKKHERPLMSISDYGAIFTCIWWKAHGGIFPPAALKLIQQYFKK